MKSKYCFILVGILLISAILFGAAYYKAVGMQGHFKGVHIIFFNGGPKGDSFATIVYNGAKAAASDLGATVEYVWSDWDAKKMALQFKEAIDKHPDAICMMGHPGDKMLRSLVDEAVRKGIIVTLQNVDIPDLRAQYIDKGFGYAGQALYTSGSMLGRGVVRKFESVKGQEALVVGPGITEDKQALNERAMRTKGVIDALEQGGLVVYAEPLPLEVEKDPGIAGVGFFAKALEAHPNIRVIVTDHGALTGEIGNILKRLGKKPGDLVVAGFDLSKQTVDGIREGYVGIVHDQQPYLQGYLPVMQACLSKKYGFSGLYIDTGVGLVDRSNVDAVAEWARQQVR
jgi:simple sugar transport system substrate-binding protein